MFNKEEFLKELRNNKDFRIDLVNVLSEELTEILQVKNESEDDSEVILNRYLASDYFERLKDETDKIKKIYYNEMLCNFTIEEKADYDKTYDALSVYLEEHICDLSERSDSAIDFLTKVGYLIPAIIKELERLMKKESKYKTLNELFLSYPNITLD